MGIERHTIADRASWLALRSHDLTASDIGAALGIDPYKSPLALYAEKTGQLMAAADSPIMRRGRWLEAAVVSAIEDEHPDWLLRRPGVYLRDPELRLGCTPDCIASTEEPGLTNIQCKVISRPVFTRDWEDGAPLHYQLQTLTEGMLMNAARSYLAALVIDTYTAELEVFEVPRHAGAEARVRDLAKVFWDNVAAGKRPPADFSRDAETVVAMFPDSVPEPVLDLTGDNRLAELLPQRATLKGVISAAEEVLVSIDTEIKAKLGEAERATLPGWKVSWKTQKRKEFVTPATTTRPLRVTATEEAAA